MYQYVPGSIPCRIVPQLRQINRFRVNPQYSRSHTSGRRQLKMDDGADPFTKPAGRISTNVEAPTNLRLAAGHGRVTGGHPSTYSSLCPP